MLDWNAVRCFVVVAQQGSLTEASQILGLSVSTLSRRIDLLEAQTGSALFRRSPSGAQLTEAGRTLLTHAEPGARHLAQMSRAAHALHDGPTDVPIRVTSTESMIADILAPRIGRLFSSHPSIKLVLDVSNELSDLQSGEADIAIRLVRPTSESLVTRRLPVIRMALYCSREYLGRRKAENLELSQEHLLWLASSYGDIAENRWLIENKLEHAVVMRAVSVRALQNAAIAGEGIAPLPSFTAEAAGLIALPQTGLPQRHPWLVFHRDTRNDRRMKRVRLWIVDACKDSFG